MAGTSPGPFQQQGITAQSSLAQGDDAKLARPCQRDLGCAAGAALDVGHRSTEDQDQSSIAPIWISNDLLRDLGELLC